MAQHFYNYSESPFNTSQGTPADHSTYGQRTGDFDVITAPDGTWDAASDGGNCVEFVGSGLNSTSTWLIYDANRGQTIADEGPDIEVVVRNFRGSDGTSGIADWRIILRAHTGTDADDSDNLYEVGLRETGGGALNANIQKRDSGSNSDLLDTEIGADHDTAWPVDTESWLRARAWDDGGTVQLKVKFWTGSAADEPASWTGETTDSTFHGVSGYHGHMAVRGEQNFDAVGVGTGGDSAPTEPVSGGTAVNVDISAGTLSLTGATQAVQAGAAPQMGAGSLSFTGQSQDIAAGASSDVQAGSLTLTPQALAIQVGIAAQIGAGTLNLTGQSLTVTASDKQTVSVDISPGTLNLSGSSLTESHGVQTDIGAGTLTLSGLAAQIAAGAAIDVQAGTLTLTGQSLDSAGGVSIDVQAGNITLSGQAITETYGHALDIGAGTLTLTGQSLSVVIAQVETPDGRTLTIPMDARTLKITADHRDIAIPDDVRSLTIH